MGAKRATPGMRELGVKLGRTGGGKISVGQAIARFLLQYLLFVFTLGISGLWMFRDTQRRALHDRIIGVKLVRVLRSWEKSSEARRFD